MQWTFSPPLSKASLMFTNNRLFLCLIFLSKVYDDKRIAFEKHQISALPFVLLPEAVTVEARRVEVIVDKPILQTGREYFRNFCGTNCFRFLEQRSNKDGVTDGAFVKA